MKRVLSISVLLFVLLLGFQAVQANTPVFQGCLKNGQVQVSVVNQGVAGELGYVLYHNEYVYDPITQVVYTLGWVEPGQAVTFMLPKEQRYETLIGVYKVADIWRYSLGSVFFPGTVTDVCSAATKMPEVEPVVYVNQCPEPKTIDTLVFDTDTELLWTSSDNAGTGLYVQAGQTAKVIMYQKDFAQILWACNPLWVKVQ